MSDDTLMSDMQAAAKSGSAGLPAVEAATYERAFIDAIVWFTTAWLPDHGG